MWDPVSLTSNCEPTVGRKSSAKQPGERYRFADAWYGGVWVIGPRRKLLSGVEPRVIRGR